MKKISAPITALIKSNNVEVFVMVSVLDQNVTSLDHDITVGGVLYSCTGKLMGVSPPSQNTAIDREAQTVTFADVDVVLRGLFNSGCVGKKVFVRLGFINKTSTSIVGSDSVSVAPGHPFRDILDTMLSYAGIIDGTGVTINVNEGSVSAEIQGSSPFGALDMRNVFMSSKEAMRARQPLDTSFDYIHIGSGNATLKWGKS